MRQWPVDGALRLPKVAAKLMGARLLTGGTVDAKQTDTGLEIAVAEAARAKVDTVVALEFDADVMKIPAVEIAPKPASN